jgi:hypothetical protein
VFFETGSKIGRAVEADIIPYFGGSVGSEQHSGLVQTDRFDEFRGRPFGNLPLAVTF